MHLILFEFLLRIELAPGCRMCELQCYLLSLSCVRANWTIFVKASFLLYILSAATTTITFLLCKMWEASSYSRFALLKQRLWVKTGQIMKGNTIWEIRYERIVSLNNLSFVIFCKAQQQTIVWIHIAVTPPLCYLVAARGETFV